MRYSKGHLVDFVSRLNGASAPFLLDITLSLKKLGNLKVEEIPCNTSVVMTRVEGCRTGGLCEAGAGNSPIFLCLF